MSKTDPTMPVHDELDELDRDPNAQPDYDTDEHEDEDKA